MVHTPYMNAHLSPQPNFLFFFQEKNILFPLNVKTPSSWTKRKGEKQKKEKKIHHLAAKVDGRRGDKRVIMNSTNNLPRKNENETKRLIGSSVVLIALSTIFVLLRLVSRKLSKAGFWVTSYFFFPSNLFFLFFLLHKWIDADCDKFFFMLLGKLIVG